MKIDIKAQDELNLAVIDKSGLNTNISVRNEVLYNKPGKDEPIEIQIQWDLSKPYLTGLFKPQLTAKEKNITHINFSSVEYSWDKEKNEEENIHKNSHDCMTDKLIWWKHSNCGHKYKLSVLDRLQGEIDCELCKYLKNPEYSFLNTNWDWIKNGVLDCMPPISIRLNWKCQTHNHEFKRNINSYHKFPLSCPVCVRIKQENDKKAKLLEKPVNKLSGTSAIERKLFYLMTLAFGDDILNRHVINKSEVDIFIPALNLAIEYDGVYWHKDKTELDKKKNTNIENKGIKLIRIREIGLEKLSSSDIIYDYNKKNLHSLLAELFSIIKKECVLNDEALKSIDNLLCQDINKIAIPKEYFMSILPKESIGYKYPHVAKDWNNDLNIEFDLFQIAEYSKYITKYCFWKCHICKFEWIDTIKNKVNNPQSCFKCFYIDKTID